VRREINRGAALPWETRRMTPRAVGAVLMACVFAAACGTRTVPLRPVSLHVTGAGEPLAGVRVHRVLETWEYEFPWIIHPNFHVNLRVEELATDADGRAEIPAARLELGRHEYIQHEWILVNLDVRPGAGFDPILATYPDFATEHGRLGRLFVLDWNGLEAFYNPLPGWRGFVAANVEWQWPSDEVQGGTVRRLHDVLWNSESLLRDREVLEVALRRPEPPPAP
jgi:hypothetical protein